MNKILFSMLTLAFLFLSCGKPLESNRALPPFGQWYWIETTTYEANQTFTANPELRGYEVVLYLNNDYTYTYKYIDPNYPHDDLTGRFFIQPDRNDDNEMINTISMNSEHKVEYKIHGDTLFFNDYRNHYSFVKYLRIYQ